MISALRRLIRGAGKDNTDLVAIARVKSTRGTAAYFFLLIATLVFTPLLIEAGINNGFFTILAALAVVVALAIVPWKPILGVYLVVVCAVTIEQEPLPSTPIGTDHLYIFYFPAQLQGLIERPIGFYILAVLFIVVAMRLLSRRRPLYGGKLFYPFIFFIACLALGVLHGLSTGGDIKIITLEVRPFWYLFISYILAYNIVDDVKHIRTILAILIIGTAIKGGQGVYIVIRYLHGHLDGVNEIMAHEQSYFFVLVLLLFMLFFLHRFHRVFFILILLSLPALLVALVANNRRTDYVALLAGVFVAWVLVIIVRPQARRRLTIALVITVLFAGAYIGAFQNSSSALGSPARAVISAFNPSAADARDAASNDYRKIEDADLKLTEAQDPILGYGFGKEFIQFTKLPDVSDLDPYYLYVPHNNILWIWMRLGPLGYIAMWNLFGSAIVIGCIMARKLKNTFLQQFAIFTVAALVMEIIVAYSDYQFFFYRNMMFIGILLGILMRLPAIERKMEGLPEQSDDDLRLEKKRRAVRPRRALYNAPLQFPAPKVALERGAVTLANRGAP